MCVLVLCEVTIGLRSQAALHCYEVDLSVSGQGGQDEEGQLEDKAFQMVPVSLTL